MLRQSSFRGTSRVGRDSLSDASIAFDQVGRTFTRKGSTLTVLRDITFDIRANEFVSLVGPSGCGKSTLLRMAAGIIQPTSGQVAVNGQRVSSLNTASGFVTQDSKLFPWLTLRQNVEYPLVVRHFAAERRAALVADHIAMMGLSGFEDHYP